MSEGTTRSEWARSKYVRRAVVGLCAAAAIGMACGRTLLNLHRSATLQLPERASRVRSGGLAPPMGSAPLPQRPLYPYSVIPGGVESAQELAAAMRHDPAVAAHYAGFTVTDAQVIKLDHDRLVYVSYRLGEKIFWTDHKVTLHKGETLISDGTQDARTRCGNRVSEIPQLPVSAAQPMLEAFDKFAGAGQIDPTIFPVVGELTPPQPLSLPAVVESPQGFLLPFFPLLPPPGGFNNGSAIPNSTSGPSSPNFPGSPGFPLGPGVPPVPTPEPATLILIGTGLSGLCLVRKFRNRS